jgi:adenylate kinase
MSNQRQVILLMGVPGIGKTTIARLLADRMEGVHTDLSDLAKKEGIIKGFDERRKTSIVDLEGMRARLNPILEDGEKPLILDGHFAADIVPPPTVSYAFVLRKAPWKLKEELRVRGYSEEKVMENIEAELLDVCLVEAVEALGSERVCEIDTTGRTPEEAADEAIHIIQGLRPCRHGHIDWLGHAESRELLEEMGRCTSS